jgi:hypothetical protein
MSPRWPFSESSVRKWIKELNPDARGPDYHPALEVRDVPSPGRSCMVSGLKSRHVHHYFSDLEYYIHVLAEREGLVVDLLDQYPMLPREDGVLIAFEQGLRPICYPGTTAPIVITMDLVPICMEGGSELLLRISAKYAADLLPGAENPSKHKRTIEKLRIEEQLWKLRNRDLAICTEKDLPIRVIRNIDAMRASMIAQEKDWLNPFLPEFAYQFQSRWTRTVPVKEVIKSVGINLKIGYADSWVLFHRCIYIRLLNIELDSETIHPEFPVALQSDFVAPKGESPFFELLRRCRNFDLTASNPIADQVNKQIRPSLLRTPGGYRRAAHC